jgi:hypothetical protein
MCGKLLRQKDGGESCSRAWQTSAAKDGESRAHARQISAEKDGGKSCLRAESFAAKRWREVMLLRGKYLRKKIAGSRALARQIPAEKEGGRCFYARQIYAAKRWRKSCFRAAKHCGALLAIRGEEGR